jgi:ABC-type spermidine/putrescine transport system permease subunit II
MPGEAPPGPFPPLRRSVPSECVPSQVRNGSTLVINAISLLLIVGTSLLAMVNLYFGKKEA